MQKSPVHRLAASLCSVLLGAAACSQPEPTASGPEPDYLYFEPIGQGQQSTLRDTTEAVVRTAAAWDTLQQDLRPLAPFDSLDFTQVMVVLAALPVESGGYSIQFETVEHFPDSIVARYVVTVPDDDCITTQALATPFQAVLVRRADGDVHFERRIETFSCAMR